VNPERRTGGITGDTSVPSTMKAASLGRSYDQRDPGITLTCSSSIRPPNRPPAHTACHDSGIREDAKDERGCRRNVWKRRRSHPAETAGNQDEGSSGGSSDETAIGRGTIGITRVLLASG